LFFLVAWVTQPIGVRDWIEKGRKNVLIKWSFKYAHEWAGYLDRMVVQAKKYTFVALLLLLLLLFVFFLDAYLKTLNLVFFPLSTINKVVPFFQINMKLMMG